MKKIVFDTDIGGDCDDTGALGILLETEKKGLCELMGITLSTSSPYAAACADAICRYYGRELPIGQTDTVPPGDDPTFFDHSYGKHISELYRGPYSLPNGKKPENAAKLLRRLLAESKEKVTVVIVGCCVNIAALLASGADELSPLTGKELVKEKVEEFALMGCWFPKNGEEIWFGDYKMEAEFNIKSDIPAAQKVFSESPVPIAVSHYEIGRNIHTGAALIEKDRKNPIAESYYVHSHGNRDSWDPVTAYYAVFGCDGYFTLSERGRVEILENGASVFRPEEGGPHRLILCPDFGKAERRLDSVLLGEA